MVPLIAGLGTAELLIILAVVVLLFGASKLPELARGSGRALRIFKAETKGLLDDDDDRPDAAAKTDSAKVLNEGTTPVTPVHPDEVDETHIHEAQVIEPEQRPNAND